MSSDRRRSDQDYDNNDEVDDIKFELIDVQSFLQSPKEAEVVKKPKLKQKSYRKKVESEWSHESTLKLIQAMEVRRNLWDTRCPEYKLPKETVWQEVADAIHMGVNDCKGKWQNLRITFNSNLDKYRKKKSGQATNESIVIAWKYFKPMMFLESTKVRQSTQSSTSMQLASGVDDHSALVDYGERSVQELVSPSSSTSGHRRRRKVATSTPSPSPSDTSRKTSLKQIAVEALQSIRSVGSQPKDPSTALCEYMASELQTLTPEQAAFARSRMRRAFNEIIDEAALI